MVMVMALEIMTMIVMVLEIMTMSLFLLQPVFVAQRPLRRGDQGLSRS